MPPELHYSYDRKIDTGRLCQGDLLQRTPELVEVLESYHAYYASRLNYAYFMVLTQSCDLVRRDSKPPKAHYITLAAVRPIEDMLIREALVVQEPWQAETSSISERGYNELANSVKSLIDNNHHKYFFYHEELAVGLSGHHCGYLTLAISIRPEHYKRCLQSKVLQLSEPFQAKLGGLIGNLYNRVGTEEFDSQKGDSAASKLAATLITGLFVVLADTKIEQATIKLKAVKPLSEYSSDEIADCARKEIIKGSGILLRDCLDRILLEHNVPSKVVGPMCEFLTSPKFKDKVSEILTDVPVETRIETTSKVIRLIVDALHAKAAPENATDWHKFRTRLVQKIVQDEPVKHLLRAQSRKN